MFSGQINTTPSTTSPHNSPRLVADIGGTFSRFGIQYPQEVAIHDIHTFENQYFDSFAAVTAAYLAKIDDKPQEAAFAIAAAIRNDEVITANIQWPFSKIALEEQFGFTKFLVLNDFEALALSLPLLTKAEYVQVGRGEPIAQYPLALIGPGTGLGVSGLIPTANGQWIPLRGEGGHTTLAAMDAKEAELIRLIQETYPHVSAERFLSSAGLPNLYEVMAKLYGKTPAPLTTLDILQQAVNNRCEICCDVLDTFCAMLGTVAGNLALTLGAQGGVYLGGGIIPRLGDYLHHSRFRERFEDKGRLHTLMKNIPTYMINADNPALRGAALALSF